MELCLHCIITFYDILFKRWGDVMFSRFNDAEFLES